jgi:hypothetical protein
MAHMRTPSKPETGIAPAVEWEPCPEFVTDDAEPGVCAGCGWFEDDHTVEVPRAA